MYNEAQLKELLDKALAGKASEEELRILADAVQDEDEYEVTERITAFLSHQPAAHPLPAEARIAGMADAILAADKLGSQSTRRAPVLALWKKIAVAAVLIVAVGLTVFYFRPAANTPATGTTTGTHAALTDKTPGYNKARLILADGTSIILDSIADGTLSVQGRTRISKSGDGQVLYSTVTTAGPGKETDGATTLYNRVVVPRGGQYKLILADGTRVWLNAASSLYFPVSFTGDQRLVELEGEGYFEVAKDAVRPFTVRTRQADVHVLGTHFNVCAYAGEDWKTTLLEGQVAVEHKEARTVLQPGNQALLAVNETKVQLIREADISEAIAWKEGYFQFNDASVAAIMQQVSRWYDVDIVYKETAGTARFNGRIDRNIRLSGIVNALKQGGINCSIEQNKLLVYP